MPQNDEAVARAARRLVAALDELDATGGDAALAVDKRRKDLIDAVRAEEVS